MRQEPGCVLSVERSCVEGFFSRSACLVLWFRTTIGRPNSGGRQRDVSASGWKSHSIFTGACDERCLLLVEEKSTGQLWVAFFVSVARGIQGRLREAPGGPGWPKRARGSPLNFQSPGDPREALGSPVRPGRPQKVRGSPWDFRGGPGDPREARGSTQDVRTVQGDPGNPLGRPGGPWRPGEVTGTSGETQTLFFAG